MASRPAKRLVELMRRLWPRREPLPAWDRVALAFALMTVVLPSFVVLWPWLKDTSHYGFHDWDVMTSHRYLAITSLREYGELPAWNPYACGGFPAWGYIESATNVVSPWLPVYWLADIRLAIRIEVLGMALIGAWGAYLAAGTLTPSRGARALVVALWATNGRFGLQAAAGHAWHLAYAILPWVFYCFECARSKPGSRAHLSGLALGFAMLVYAGGIYPLPHTVLVIALWAAGVAIVERSLRPLATLAIGGAAGVGLAAPKLLPMLATFERAPRVIESNELLEPGAFVTLLTSRAQGFFERPAHVTPYGWHEWGMYVSLPGAVLLACGLVLARGKKELVLKIVALSLIALGFGAFHPAAPWSLLHRVSIFRSQHVPSRFLYPAVLVAGLVLASFAGRLVSERRARFAYGDALLAFVALLLALDVALVAQKPMQQAMVLSAPPSLRPAAEFQTDKRAELSYVPRDWAPPMYLAMLQNRGVLECYGAPPFDGRGAIERRDLRYRGEVFVQGSGSAHIRRWTPNGARVELGDVRSGSRLILNQNFDAGWQATVENASGAHEVRVFAFDNRVALELPQGESVVTLRYRPPGFGIGVALAIASALGLLAGAAWHARFARPSAEASPA